MDVFKDNQHEALNNSGFQKWHKVRITDFGGSLYEASVMPYETWEEPDLTPFAIFRGVRGEGDFEENNIRVTRRARTKVRHLCKILKAAYMITLTTKKAIYDRTIFEKLFQEFSRRVRLVQGFEYVAVLEKHNSEFTSESKQGSYHLHIAVATRQNYKLLWNIWLRVCGEGQGRVFVSSGNKKASISKIASYISKYISKETGSSEFNKRRYWSSKGIAKPIVSIVLMRPDWTMLDILRYLHSFFDGVGLAQSFTQTWLDEKKGLFWCSMSK